MESYKDLFDVSPPGSNYEFTEKVIAKTKEPKRIKSNHSVIQNIIAASAGMALVLVFGCLTALGVFVDKSDMIDDGYTEQTGVSSQPVVSEAVAVTVNSNAIEATASYSDSSRYSGELPPDGVANVLPIITVVSAPVTVDEITEESKTPHNQTEPATITPVTEITITELPVTTLYIPVHFSGSEIYVYLRNSGIDDNKLTELVNSGEIPSDITQLCLSGNKISDITPLSGLTQLNTLFLDGNGNQISNLAPLRGLTNLKFLYIDDNCFTDLSPLYELTNLQRLYLCYSGGQSISQERVDLLQNALPNLFIVFY